MAGAQPHMFDNPDPSGAQLQAAQLNANRRLGEANIDDAIDAENEAEYDETAAKKPQAVRMLFSGGKHGLSPYANAPTPSPSVDKKNTGMVDEADYDNEAELDNAKAYLTHHDLDQYTSSMGGVGGGRAPGGDPDDYPQVVAEDELDDASFIIQHHSNTAEEIEAETMEKSADEEILEARRLEEQIRREQGELEQLEEEIEEEAIDEVEEPQEEEEQEPAAEEANQELPEPTVGDGTSEEENEAAENLAIQQTLYGANAEIDSAGEADSAELDEAVAGSAAAASTHSVMNQYSHPVTPDSNSRSHNTLLIGLLCGFGSVFLLAVVFYFARNYITARKERVELESARKAAQGSLPLPYAHAALRV